jgi:hypothetical protein
MRVAPSGARTQLVLFKKCYHLQGAMYTGCSYEYRRRPYNQVPYHAPLNAMHCDSRYSSSSDACTMAGTGGADGPGAMAQ